jgi:hypothetical protein
MNSLTIKIPPRLEDEILAVCAAEHLSKAALVQRALETYLAQRKSITPATSVLDQASDLVGCFAGGPADLASNPEHLADFGKV